MSNRSRKERGAASLGFAIVLPLLLVLAFGIIDVVGSCSRTSRFTRRRRRGRSFAGRFPADSGLVQERVVDSVSSPSLSTGDLTVACEFDGADTLTVAVVHDMELITPLFAPRTVELRAEVTSDVFGFGSCDATD